MRSQIHFIQLLLNLSSLTLSLPALGIISNRGYHATWNWIKTEPSDIYSLDPLFSLIPQTERRERVSVCARERMIFTRPRQVGRQCARARKRERERMNELMVGSSDRIHSQYYIFSFYFFNYNWKGDLSTSSYSSLPFFLSISLSLSLPILSRK